MSATTYPGDVIDRDDLEPDTQARFPRRWIYQDDEMERCFDTEEEACAFQRSRKGKA